MRKMKPFAVEVRSTLGAGDTFKAGCVYGLLKGMTDEELDACRKKYDKEYFEYMSKQQAVK